MFLALILACTTPSFQSCGVLVKADELFMTEEACQQDAGTVAAYLLSEGTYAIPYCVRLTSVGEPV